MPSPDFLLKEIPHIPVALYVSYPQELICLHILYTYIWKEFRNAFSDWGCSSVLQQVLSMREVLSSIIKNNNNKKTRTFSIALRLLQKGISLPIKIIIF
jgi:hypothetical protein